MTTLIILLAALAQEEPLKIPLLPPGPGNPRNSEGDFAALKDGRILFVYTRFSGSGDGDHAPADLVSRVSEDGGRTWSSKDELVLAREGGMNVMSVSLARLGDGRLALFYLRKVSLQDCRARMRTSSDEGKTWSEPVLVMPEPAYYVVNNDRVIRTSKGRLIVPAAKHGYANGKISPGAAQCFLSDDDGRSWRAGAEIAPPEGSRSGLQEPLVEELKGGRLLMLQRTDRGAQFRSFSEDGGETWSAAEASSLRSPLSPASVERLPSGELLLVWNDHSDAPPSLRGKRTPLRAALSADEGATWGAAKTLEDAPDGWYCYTAIEVVGEHVLLAYCAGDPKVGHLNRTVITRVPLAWLRR
jgi:sialidase-1